MKTIKTFKGACKFLDLDADKVIPNFSCYPKKDRESLESHAKLIIICDALNRSDNDNEEWFPDWSDDSQFRYQPYFNMKDSSSFKYVDFGSWKADSFVGSRICFKTPELAEYAGKQFKNEFKTYFLK